MSNDLQVGSSQLPHKICEWAGGKTLPAIQQEVSTVVAKSKELASVFNTNQTRYIVSNLILDKAEHRNTHQVYMELKSREADVVKCHLDKRRKVVEVKQLESKVNVEGNVFTRELLEIEITKLRYEIDALDDQVEALFREILVWGEHLDTNITPDDYEKVSREENVTSMMRQGIRDMRMNGGHSMSGGVQEYCEQLGLNVQHVMQDIRSYLQQEQQPDHNGNVREFCINYAKEKTNEK